MLADISLSQLELRDLEPVPGDEWQRMLAFVQFGQEDRDSMSHTVEILLRNAPELVVQTYNYLSSVPETAAILGWETRVDEDHLAERRRFFAVWVSRTLGIDTSSEFAEYLFRAGQFHAGHGPRRIHTPAAYVTGSIALIQSAFGTILSESNLPSRVIGRAMAGWGKFLTIQLHMMLLGYRVARDYEAGDYPVQIELYGRLRRLAGARSLSTRAVDGSTVSDVLHKFFSYFPHTRAEALERVWRTDEESDSLWMEVTPAFVPRSGWRVLLNGRNLQFNGGFQSNVQPQDVISIFPPGR